MFEDLDPEGRFSWFPLPECPLFSTVTLIMLVWPINWRGGRALLTCTFLVTILIGDWRNPPQRGNWVAQRLGSKPDKRPQTWQILGVTDCIQSYCVLFSSSLHNSSPAGLCPSVFWFWSFYTRRIIWLCVEIFILESLNWCELKSVLFTSMQNCSP